MRTLVVLAALLAASCGGKATLDGARIHYHTAGAGPETVVLIHGWTCDHTLWSAQTEALAARYRVLALDLPGHGQSAPAPDYTMARFARAVDAVLRAEGVDRAVLVGHSMGGAVMLEFARLFPDKLRAIVAVDAMFPEAGSMAGFADFAARFEGPDAMTNREEMVRGMFTDATTPAVRAQIEKVMLGAPAATAAGAMRGIADEIVWRPGTVDVPFLQIAAASSVYLTEEGMKQRFPRAAFVRVPGTGHFLQMEKPDEVNRILLDWIAALD